MKLKRPLVVLDLETTGVWIEKDRIIEIGMVKLHPDGKKEIYASRVNPCMPIPPVVTELTGISDADVKDAPVFGTVAPQVLAFLDGADLGGFNVERFDLPLLARELGDAGIKFQYADRSVYDAQKIYHLHERRDLAAAFAFYCHQELKGAHSATADAQATLEILAEQLKRYAASREDIESLQSFDYKQTGEYFDNERKFRWWNGELYMTFGKYAKKEPLKTIAKKDPQYLAWVLAKDFSDEVKAMIQDVLNGRHPRQDGAGKD
ncbi:MAG: 3'-5' exonuclease [Candidatus Omnitrophica bacterium]|nr:3'-5' exonuclease [Candidatus Omnitrophota bacterium]MDE2010407.1 3'-5' exonuclease [Candidatus Omnitrophota bacterium]MDE2214762.1 3'-5' exonuclease [Candidatus Omnitrophota bacterium]MDE2231455.1 3'-5' exonuclease [Candidatus Omnitrophota bacterium]